MSNPSYLQVGTISGTPILADVSAIGNTAVAYVTLSAGYTLLEPPGYPKRPGMVGVSATNLDYARTLPSGTRVLFFQCEAAAIVAASGGSYS